MFRNNIIESLPQDNFSEVASYLDFEATIFSTRVCKGFSKLFNQPTIWKNRLEKDFGIDPKLLANISHPDANKNERLYKLLCKHLYCLSKKPDLPIEIKNIIQNKTQESLLLLTRLENCVDEFKSLPGDEQYLVALLSIYTNGFDIPVAFIEQNREKKSIMFLLNHAGRAGNLKLQQYFWNPKNGFKITSPQDITYDGPRSGDLQSVEYLLDPKNNFGLIPNEVTLNFAASTGNLHLVRYLLDKKIFGLNPTALSLQLAAKSGNLQLVKYLSDTKNLSIGIDALNRAAESGSLQLVQYCFDSIKKSAILDGIYLEIEFMRLVLRNAIKSGNLELVKYLLDHENHFKLNHDRLILSMSLNLAVESGSLSLVQFLLNPENHFGITCDKHTLDNAALSGSLQLVEYLLKNYQLTVKMNTLYNAVRSGNLPLVQHLVNLAKKLKLTPDEVMLNTAVEIGDLRLVQYLLNFQNKFDLNPTQRTLKLAAESNNFEIAEHILPCHIKIQVALQKLQEEDFSSANKFLEESAVTCSYHHKLQLQYILTHPKDRDLSDKAINLLNEHEKEQQLIAQFNII